MRSTGSGTSLPTIAQVAASMKLLPRTFETNGKERDARKLHSMTLSSSSSRGPEAGFLMICMLNGPEISKAFATFSAMTLRRLISVSASEKGGKTRVASPEWTPAFSTCSETACTRSLPLYATASTSISCALSMNLVMTTG